MKKFNKDIEFIKLKKYNCINRVNENILFIERDFE